MSSENAQAVVIGILKTEFPLLAGLELGAETPLLSAGLLDSFALITLISELEKAFEIDIDVENLELESFETPASITLLCGRH